MSDTSVVAEDGPDYRGIWFFGQDLNKIECFRDSFLNGFIGVAVGSVIGYLYKNQFRVALHGAFISYSIAVWGTWFSCRYSRHKSKKFWKDFQITVEDNVEKSGDYNIPPLLKKGKMDMSDE